MMILMHAKEGFILEADKIPDDIELVKKARKNDTSAFEKLYRKHVGRIYALAVRMTEDSRIAEEIVQEIFVRVWQKLDLFEGRSSFYTWLHRLAINFILNEKRSKSRHHKNEILMDENMLESTDRNNRELSMDLEKAISGLPEGAKEVFVLYDIEGMQHDEIARLKNITVGTSKSQLHRARKILREVLNYEM
jgi:RNA polymerase sigma-70 factor (ECF subfamily)